MTSVLPKSKNKEWLAQGMCPFHILGSSVSSRYNAIGNSKLLLPELAVHDMDATVSGQISSAGKENRPAMPVS